MNGGAIRSRTTTIRFPPPAPPLRVRVRGVAHEVYRNVCAVLCKVRERPGRRARLRCDMIGWWHGTEQPVPTAASVDVNTIPYAGPGVRQEDLKRDPHGYRWRYKPATDRIVCDLTVTLEGEHLSIERGAP